MKSAIFPGSFDPFTLGHIDVLKSALGLFDKIIIAVGYNHLKSGYFSPATRVKIINDSIRPLVDSGSIIEVCSYTGLTIELCKRMDTFFIIRGLRTTTDFELESVIAQANKKMAPYIQTVFIPASQEFSFISSTVVRDVLVNGGDVAPFISNNINISSYLSLKNEDFI